jgi:hypothetical protein
MPVTTLKLNGYRRQEPITKITNPGVTAAAGSTAVFEVKQGVAICGVLFTVTVTAAATGAATKTVPNLGWAIREMRCRIGNNVNRQRYPVSYFGYRGVAAINSLGLTGRVKYTQGGAVVTAALNGITYGNEPVLIGGPEDLAIQGALANNTATVATFSLPWMFSEDFRNDPAWAGEAMALLTGFDDGKGNLTGLLANTITFELDQLPAAGSAVSPATAASVSAIAVAGSLIYTQDRALQGSVVQLSKQKVHQKAYTASANGVDLGDVFDQNGTLQRFSLLTVADQITRVQVVQGANVIRDVTFADNETAMDVSGCNTRSPLVNRFDVELDLNDDPTTALRLSGLRDLKVIAWFATANDNPANVTILADYYGPVE